MDQVSGNDWVPSFYGYDGKGSVRQLYDQYGTVTDTYDYDAFGNLIGHTGSTYNNYQYTGEQFDADLGLYYLRARYHNPNSGRMWTMDSFEGFDTDPQSLHKYTFNHNDPVNRRDPSGHISMGETMLVSGLAPLVRMSLDPITTGIYNFSHGQAGGEALKAKTHEEALYIDSLGAGADGLQMGRSNFYNTQRGAPFLLGWNTPWSQYRGRAGCGYELVTGADGFIYGCPAKHPIFENTYDSELLDVAENWAGFTLGVARGMTEAVTDAATLAANAFGTIAAISATVVYGGDEAYAMFGENVEGMVGMAQGIGTMAGGLVDLGSYYGEMATNGTASAEEKYGASVEQLGVMLDMLAGGAAGRDATVGERLGYILPGFMAMISGKLGKAQDLAETARAMNAMETAGKAKSFLSRAQDFLTSVIKRGDDCPKKKYGIASSARSKVTFEPVNAKLTPEAAGAHIREVLRNDPRFKQQLTEAIAESRTVHASEVFLDQKTVDAILDDYHFQFVHSDSLKGLNAPQGLIDAHATASVVRSKAGYVKGVEMATVKIERLPPGGAGAGKVSVNIDERALANHSELVGLAVHEILETEMNKAFQPFLKEIGGRMSHGRLLEKMNTFHLFAERAEILWMLEPFKK